MAKQVHVYYTGRVQGVGFRYTTEEIARGLGVYGWVRNLPDGRVEVTAEAGEAALENFLARVNQQFFRYIQNADVNWRPATGEFTDFGIRF
jgi:acylphosphatase